MKKRILIISPIADIGGRELEVGFIASVLAKKYIVKVISTNNFSKKSQLLTFKGFYSICLNQLIFKENFYARLLVRVTSYFKKNYSNHWSSLSNPFLKKLLKLELKKNNVLKSEVLKSDLIFICAQLTSNYLPSIIPFAKKNNKKVVFRTTGLINKNDKFEYLKYVDMYLHHSLINANKLAKEYNYKIIDQCSFNEKELIKLPILKRKVNNFMTVSRIHKDKNIDVVINAFTKNKDINDRLYVVGDGPELIKLKESTTDNRVIFTGFIENNELQKIYNLCECFIVSYYKLEAGPLTAVEAMAAGKIIISSKTGAMTERLIDKYAFWHNNEENDLLLRIKEVKKLKVDEVKKISQINRDKYLLEYSKKSVEEKYLESIRGIFFK